ncbi:replication-associated recombination protein A [Candidatus Sumerlaeota bacterium]|nr:replication-associated recombination protein A [Candidatus Sumerlaeota bacterium]
MDLFNDNSNDAQVEHASPHDIPLAERMRPRTLDEFIGQERLVGPDSMLRRLIAQDTVPSLIFWGPPGTGKTTLAAIIAHSTKARFRKLSAVTSGKADITRVINEAKELRRIKNLPTILFVDEIHRFNKVQQDAFLPHVEDGTICLMGATTENPSFSVIAPLLSRAKVFTIESLNNEHIETILRRALEDEEHGLGGLRVELDAEVMPWLCRLADGDARRALNLLEIAVRAGKPRKDGSHFVALDAIKELTQRNQLIYDRSGEEHFNLISALHKSIRSSDPQAAVYWLTRMLEAGEDALYCARRMIRMASEDIGLSDPNALTVANQAKTAYESLGTPEGELALVQCAIYLATAPKSNAAYMAHLAAQQDVRRHGSLPVPLHIRNAPTQLMKDLDYGKDYQYDHDHEHHYSGQDCLPEQLFDRSYYTPSKFGFEKEIQKRLDWWKSLKDKNTDQKE